MQAMEAKLQEIPGGKSNGTKIPEFLTIEVNLVRLSHFPEILGSAVIFITGNFPEIQSRSFG